jgi:hypothetical protein
MRREVELKLTPAEAFDPVNGNMPFLPALVSPKEESITSGQ